MCDTTCVVVEKRNSQRLLPMKYTKKEDSSCPAMSIHSPLSQIREEADSGAYIPVMDEYVNSHTPWVATGPVSQIHNCSRNRGTEIETSGCKLSNYRYELDGQRVTTAQEITYVIHIFKEKGRCNRLGAINRTRRSACRNECRWLGFACRWRPCSADKVHADAGEMSRFTAAT